MKRTVLLVFAVAIALLPFATRAAAADAVKPLLLLSFEKADELKTFQLDSPVKESMKAEVVPDNKTVGKTCLKVTYPDTDWADIQFTTSVGDWSKYNMLKVDIFNPTKSMIGIQFQGCDKDAGISKEAYFGSPEKRVSCTFMLKPGKNDVVFPLKFDKPFDLKAVKMWSISTISRPKGLVLFIDNIRLDKGDLKDYEQ
jgi:hypothetical protein